jgi:hypothetical protein
MKLPRYLTDDESRLSAMVLVRIHPMFSIVTPCKADTSSVSVIRASSTTDS